MTRLSFGKVDIKLNRLRHVPTANKAGQKHAAAAVWCALVVYLFLKQPCSLSPMPTH